MKKNLHKNTKLCYKYTTKTSSNENIMMDQLERNVKRSQREDVLTNGSVRPD